jgi:hypothetical protein
VKTRPSVLALALSLALFGVRASAQSHGGGDPSATPEDHGAIEGRVEGRRQGLEIGQDQGRAQALARAWMRGFREGLERASSWSRDASWDEGLSEGLRPGRAEGLDAGRPRGSSAAAAAYLRLQGRPTLVSEAAPEPPVPPPPPLHPACAEPASIVLRFNPRRSVELRPHELGEEESPLGWDEPRPDYPGESSLRDRARNDGYEGDAMDGWIRGYKTTFKSEFQQAFRNTRDMTPGHLLRDWEAEGEIEGRREGRRRRSCDDFVRGFATGWRDGFGEGFDRGFAEGWDAESQRHDDNAVVRVLSARLIDETADGVIEPGEGVRAEIEIANAGLVEAARSALAYEGVRTLHARGEAGAPLPAQSRRAVRLDLGRADEGAPFGAGIEVALRGLNGDAQALTATIGRPVVIDAIEPRLGVADGELVLRLRTTIASVATKEAERGLALRAGEVSSPLGVVTAGERRDVDLILPASASWLAETSTGRVELRAGDETWLRRDWALAPAFGDSLQVAATLPAGSARLDEALTSLSRRLLSELGHAR